MKNINFLIDLSIIILISLPTGVLYNEFSSVKFSSINIYFIEIYLIVLAIYILLKTKKIIIRKNYFGLISFIFIIYLFFFTVINMFQYNINAVLNDVRFLWLLIFIFIIPKEYFNRIDKDKIFTSIIIGTVILAGNLLIFNHIVGLPYEIVTSRNNIWFVVAFFVSLLRLVSTKKNMKTLVYSLLVIIFLVFIIFVESRTLYLITIIGVIYIFIKTFSFRSIIKYTGMLIFSIFCIQLLINHFELEENFKHYYDRVDSITRIDESASYEIRVNDNKEIVDKFNVHYLYGLGPGSMLLQDTNQEYAYYIDNTYLVYFFKFGIFGLFFIIAFILQGFNRTEINKEFTILKMIIAVSTIFLAFTSALLYHNYFIYVYLLIVLQDDKVTKKINELK